MHKSIGILFLSVCFAIQSFCQSPNLIFRHITKNNGLPVENVTCLAQDSTGYIWIGTIDGLFRFDGFNYQGFYAAHGAASELQTNYIYSLYVDTKGRIWIVTYGGGLSMIDPAVGLIKQVKPLIRGKSYSNAVFIRIKEDKSGNLWFTGNVGLFKLSGEDNTWNLYSLAGKVGRELELYQLSFDNSGRIIIGGFSGLCIFDPAANEFIYAKDPLQKTLQKSTCFSSLIYHRNKLWFATWNPDFGMYDIESDKLNFFYSDAGVPKPDFDKMPREFYADSRGGLWIRSDDGLQFVASGDQQVTSSFVHEAGNPYSLISSKVECVLEDREHKLWLGTDAGISVADPYNLKVSNYSINAGRQLAFSDKKVSDVFELDDHNIFVGTLDGLYLTDPHLKVLKHFKFDDFNYNWIWGHYKDDRRKLVYITTHHGLLEYNERTKDLVKSRNNFLISKTPFSSMIHRPGDVVWISLFRDKFLKYNLKTGQHKEFSISSLNEPYQVIILREDNNNALWILGHTSGIMKFDEQKQAIVEKLAPDTSNNSLRQAGVWVFLDLGESYFIGYDILGFSLYHKHKKQFEHFTKDEGLVSNSVKDAFVAKDKTVWIATANGISHFYPNSKTFVNYNEAQGIIQNEIYCISQLSDGRIVAGTKKGLFSFSPDSMNAPATPAPIITDVTVLGKKVYFNVNSDKKVLDLSYKENYFSFDFISLQFSNNQQIEYAYKMEGLQNDWLYSASRRYVSYANIPAGSYRFKVRSRLPGGKWTECKTPLAIHIEAAFYTRWWFFLIVCSLVAILIYAAFRYRINQLLKLERVRSSISSDLHDEVGASLTSISIFSEMARKLATPLSKEDQYLQRIGDRSRESIEKMGDIIWSINPNNDSLEQMLLRMKTYTTEVAEAKEVNLLLLKTHYTNKSGKKLNMEQRKNI